MDGVIEVELSPYHAMYIHRRDEGIKCIPSPRCGGRLRVIATVQDSAVVRTILAHLARAHSTEPPGPAAPAPAAIV
jgi:hypothetical protein